MCHRMQIPLTGPSPCFSLTAGPERAVTHPQLHRGVGATPGLWLSPPLLWELRKLSSLPQASRKHGDTQKDLGTHLGQVLESKGPTHSGCLSSVACGCVRWQHLPCKPSLLGPGRAAGPAHLWLGQECVGHSRQAQPEPLPQGQKSSPLNSSGLSSRRSHSRRWPRRAGRG